MWCLWIHVNFYSIFINENKKILQNHNYLVHKVLYENHIKIKIRTLLPLETLIYSNQIKLHLVWENTSAIQSTLMRHIGYANHRLLKMGEFFILSPQEKQNFWKCNALSDKWLWFLVIFGVLGRFGGILMRMREIKGNE